MDFRRIVDLPPYVFTTIDSLKVAARRSGVDLDPDTEVITTIGAKEGFSGVQPFDVDAARTR